MPKYKVSKHLTDKGWPTSSKKYSSAHKSASEDEKHKFGKRAFKKSVKLEHKLSKHELLGKTTRKGKILVEKRVPKSMRNEIAYHEQQEYKRLKKK